MNLHNYDTILLMESMVTESVPDARFGQANQGAGTETYGLFGNINANTDFHFGAILKRSVQSGLGGATVEVTDFGSDIAVSVHMSNVATGKSAGQSFLIKFSDKAGNGIVKSSAVRYRTINNVNQAIGYIINRCSSLRQKLTSHN